MMTIRMTCLWSKVEREKRSYLHSSLDRLLFEKAIILNTYGIMNNVRRMPPYDTKKEINE